MRWLWLVMLLWTAVVNASPKEMLTFRDEAQEQQYRQLTAELRCPKCQNNSIAESGSMIAGDLRLKVYQLLQEGKSRQQIIDYMVARYGQFVTYDPPLTPITSLLWGVPAAALLFGAAAIVMRSRRRERLEERHTLTETVASGQSSGWLFLPGIVGALGVATAVWLATNHVQEVQRWQVAVAQTPEHLSQALDPNAAPLDAQELDSLALGLRSRLHDDPQSVSGWIVLGHIAMMQGNAQRADAAFSRALELLAQDDPRRAEVMQRLVRARQHSDGASR